MSAGPVAVHVRDLGRTLRGPARVRAGMLAELRAGLEDAADAHRAAGLDEADAERRAVADFGPVAVVGPEVQAELTAVQGRRTARSVLAVFVTLPLLWDVAWRTSDPGPLASRSAAAPALNTLQDASSLLVVVVGVLLLVLLRRAPARRLALLASVAGLVGGLLCGSLAVAQNIVDPAATAAWVRSSPLLLVAYAASLAGLVLVLTSSARSLRLLRAG